MTDHNYCIILAGGKGRRLWPASREQKPKQFMDFFGNGRTLLQQTYERFLKIMPADHIYVNTNERYADMVREQLPDLQAEQLLAEPIFRNTAPGVTWTLHRIKARDPEAAIIVSPSDQAVENEDAFQGNILGGLDFVSSNDCMLTMGVKPTRPEPGYGYIQLGESAEHGVFKVQSFTEKPERNFAKMFMDSGEFYWNTGLFLGNVCHFYETLTRHLPRVFKAFDEQYPSFDAMSEDAFVQENFPLYPNLSLDRAILEQSDNVYMMRCDFGWADLGTWHAIYETMQKSPSDNVTIDSDVILEDSKSNIIRLPKGRKAVIHGLEGYIVVEEGNMLLICPKEDSSALVRKYVNEARMRYGDDFV